MPKSKNKAQIVKRLQTERKRLEQNLSRISQDDMVKTGVVGDSSIKDVLAHLADWEAHMPVWIKASRRGDPVACPDPGLTWKQLDIMNERIYQAHRDQPLPDVLGYFRSTHDQFMEMVETMPEQEMLAHERHAFVGKDAVYDWLKGYANHDLWGKTMIRKWMQTKHKLGKKSRSR